MEPTTAWVIPNSPCAAWSLSLTFVDIMRANYSCQKTVLWLNSKRLQSHSLTSPIQHSRWSALTHTCMPGQAQQEELRRRTYRRKLFVEQGERVAQRYPGSSEEISWRVNYLNNKWDQLESNLTPAKGRNQEVEVELGNYPTTVMLCFCVIPELGRNGNVAGWGKKLD